MTTNHKMQQNDAANNGLARVFDGRALQFRTHGGRPCVAAANLGAVLGYEQPRALVDKIRGPWREEFVEGVDLDVLTGDELAAWNDSSDSLESPASPGGARSLVVLYESGARLAAIKARTPAGVKVRRWLAEVWGEIARTGQYVATKPANDPAVTALAAQVEAMRATLEALTVRAMAAPVGNGVTLDRQTARVEVLLPIRRLAARRAKVDPVRDEKGWRSWLHTELRARLGMGMRVAWAAVSVDRLHVVREFVTSATADVQRREAYAETGKPLSLFRTPRDPETPAKN